MLERVKRGGTHRASWPFEILLNGPDFKSILTNRGRVYLKSGSSKTYLDGRVRAPSPRHSYSYTHPLVEFEYVNIGGGGYKKKVSN